MPHQHAPKAVPLGELGYPYRSMVVFAAALAIALIFLVLPMGRAFAGTCAALTVLAAGALVVARTRRLANVRARSVNVMNALGALAADLPMNIRTRMPLVLVTGDALGQLFNRGGTGERFAYVGDGAIWLRVDRPQDLARIAVAAKEWRDGRPADGVVLSIAPALHTDEETLTNLMRSVRRAVGDASRLLSTKLPGYIAVYQRLTPALSTDDDAPQWYGVSSATPLNGAQRFETAIRAAELEVQRAEGAPEVAARAAGLASLIGWTQRVVLDTLTDMRQPAAPWALFGVGWIDCGPTSSAGTSWTRAVQAQTRVTPPTFDASRAPWPLPQPLIEAMPRQHGVAPRTAALAHTIAIVACACALAMWGAARNNHALLERIGAALERYSSTPSSHVDTKRDALQALTDERDALDRYSRTAVPLRLSFGMYRGAPLLPVLNHAIASYRPPSARPFSSVVTLDSMSLFESGRATLRRDTTRAMVSALELIQAHPHNRILIAGHTDNVGNDNGNLKLSIARASAVRDWLIDASGMDVTQFAIQGYGDTRPIASNDTPEGRAKNRRVEITLVPDVSGG
jgi:outer membrane protein OmpA-like peptidoglycan-associated protein